MGLIGTVGGIVGAFGELSDVGDADPEAVAGDISGRLLPVIWGFVVSGIAFVFLGGALIRFFTLPKEVAAPPKYPNSGKVGGQRRK